MTTTDRTAVTTPSFLGVVRAMLEREWISHRLNRFLHAHVILTLAAGCLVLLTPRQAMATGAAVWMLYAVLYAVSLSAILLGLSSAHGEVEEMPILLSQPAGTGALIAGKLGALAAIVILANTLLVIPSIVAGGWSQSLVNVAAGAAGVGVVCASLGLATGLWIRDAVRGLIAAVAIWFVLLFGTDLALLALAGVPRVQHHADFWVLPLMLNPLDAFRVTVLFAVERVAYAGIEGGRLAGWWVDHAWTWLAVLVSGWLCVATAVARAGIGRRIDG